MTHFYDSSLCVVHYLLQDILKKEVNSHSMVANQSESFAMLLINTAQRDIFKSINMVSGKKRMVALW